MLVQLAGHLYSSVRRIGDFFFLIHFVSIFVKNGVNANNACQLQTSDTPQSQIM
jgi:hypothetical protein